MASHAAQALSCFYAMLMQMLEVQKQAKVMDTISEMKLGHRLALREKLSTQAIGPMTARPSGVAVLALDRRSGKKFSLGSGAVVLALADGVLLVDCKAVEG